MFERRLEMGEYKPAPVNTDHITLTAEMEELVEMLAKNAHDVWASQRLKDSWTYGPHRDDGTRIHPCLVAYEDLPESEKTYDRVISEQLIKTLLAKGYRIVR